MSDKISVIIPTYNRKSLLGATLNSILNQSLQASEIIVVDNGSSDGTIDFVRTNYSDKVITLENKGNNSPGAARNLGFSVATGDYIKFFDSDDLMTSNTLDVQYRLLANAEKGFIYGPYFYAKELENGDWEQIDPAILNYHPFSKKRTLSQWMLRGLFITIPGMLFKRELIEEAGAWREDIIAYEDWDYLFRLSLVEPLPLHNNECAFLYRRHTNQTVSKNFNDHQRDLQKIAMLRELWKSHVQKNDSFSWYEKQLFRNNFYQTKRMLPTEEDIFQDHEILWYDWLFWNIIRFRRKKGRLRTKTDWQPEHGTIKDDQKYRSFMSLIVGN
jgi:hypothetical protein